MRANPGGHLAPGEVLGRDGIIDLLWRTLEVQSVVITAERRMGKTSVINKMLAAPVRGMTPISRDLEGIAAPLEFTARFASDVLRLSGKRRGAKLVLEQVLGRVAGAKLGAGGLSVKLPEGLACQWKDLMATAVEKALEIVAPDKLVLFWDEVPYMVYKIGRGLGPDAAIEVLDTLRALRQTHPNLRMVFTGSIGLRGVLMRLRAAGHANAAVNDMRWIELPPLDRAAATDLARRLLAGEGVQVANVGELAATIAAEVDGAPYYVHHVVAAVREGRAEATPAGVRAHVAAMLVEPSDPWELRHFRERLDQHYEDAERRLALGLLDAACVLPAPETFRGLVNLMSHQEATDVELVRRVVAALEGDHYLLKDPDGRLAFKYPLIRRWWFVQRGPS